MLKHRIVLHGNKDAVWSRKRINFIRWSHYPLSDLLPEDILLTNSMQVVSPSRIDNGNSNQL